jgi:TPR repeat protein
MRLPFFLVLAATGFAQNYHQMERSVFQVKQLRHLHEENFYPALGGDAQAQFLLGWKFLSHHRQEDGLRWLKTAAVNGHPLACWLVADQAFQSKPQRPEEVVLWLRRAAELGFVEAQSGLARLYETGQFVDRDMNQAVAWYRLAAAQRQPEASFRLARILARNPETVREAEELLRIAADAEDSRALYELAILQLRREPRLAKDPLFLSLSQQETDSWPRAIPGYPMGPLSGPLSPRGMLEESLRLGCAHCGPILGLLFDKGLAGASRDPVRAYQSYATFKSSNAELLARVRKIAAERERHLSKKNRATLEESRRRIAQVPTGAFCVIVDHRTVDLRPLL